MDASFLLFANRARWTGWKSRVSGGRGFVAIGADGLPGSLTEAVGKPAELLPARRCAPRRDDGFVRGVGRR